MHDELLFKENIVWYMSYYLNTVCGRVDCYLGNTVYGIYDVTIQ